MKLIISPLAKFILNPDKSSKPNSINSNTTSTIFLSAWKNNKDIICKVNIKNNYLSLADDQMLVLYVR